MNMNIYDLLDRYATLNQLLGTKRSTNYVDDNKKLSEIKDTTTETALVRSNIDRYIVINCDVKCLY